MVARKYEIYFECEHDISCENPMPGSGKNNNACTFYNMFSDWSTIFHTWFLIG